MWRGSVDELQVISPAGRICTWARRSARRAFASSCSASVAARSASPASSPVIRRTTAWASSGPSFPLLRVIDLRGENGQQAMTNVRRTVPSANTSNS